LSDGLLKVQLGLLVGSNLLFECGIIRLKEVKLIIVSLGKMIV
jgi:hypothetical protein